MKTAFLFPGLNGLLRKADRERYLGFPEVRERVAHAESILRERHGIPVSLNEFLSRPTAEIYALANVNVAAVVICAIQVGISDRLREAVGDPDWVMGCSLGDLARTVFAGAYDFEQAIYNHIRFTRSVEGIDRIGRNIGVATRSAAGFSDADYEWFDGIRVDVSRLTPRFINVGGRFSDLERIESRAKDAGWRVVPILDYPAHSRYILPYVQRVEPEFRHVETREPRIPIFSSLTRRPLARPEEIKKEFLECIAQTIDWHRAVHDLIRDQGVGRFVNVGPCQSLSKMMAEIQTAAPVQDAWDLVH